MLPMQSPHILLRHTLDDGTISEYEIWGDSISGEMLGAGAATVTGSPAKIRVSMVGLVAQAAKINATSAIADDGQYYPKHAELSGNASLRFDSVTPGSILPLQGQYLAGFDAPAITLDVVSGEYKIDIQNNFHGTFSYPSLQIGDQRTSIDVKGGAAQFKFVPSAPELADMNQVGDIEGPIQIQYRDPLAPSANVESAEIDASADHAHINLSGSNRTITLTGNVKLDGKGRGLMTNATGAELVMTLDADNRLTSIALNGKPSRAEITRGGGK